MDYKQKYEEALEIARCYEGLRAEMEIIFPELKQSEDEKMINFISHELACLRATDEKSSDRYNELTEAIIWLEKQNKHQKFLNKIQVGDELTKNARGNLVNLSQLKRIAKPRNKQKGEQKPANKAEPKFKVGDIIINDYGFIMQIDGIDSNMYAYHVLDGTCIFKHDITKTEESCHLWTIQDAKEGDVLYYKSPLGIEYIVMSSGVNRFGNIDSYFRYNSVDGFGISVPSVFNTKEDITPATKEQRDLLFQEMKEAGYEWDAEKKELKKIEQRSIKWSEKDEEVFHCLDYTVKHYYDNHDIIDKCCSWLKSIKQRMKGE